MNQCIQEQIENSNVQAVVEAIVFKKYSRSRRQISYLSQITIGEQQGFIILEQEQIEQIISENLLANRIEVYEYELSQSIFQKELKKYLATNDSLNNNQQGSNEQQKINQQEHELNDFELESNKVNVSLQREQQIFSDFEGENICDEKNILNQEEIQLSENLQEKDAAENLGFIEENYAQKESNTNKDQQGDQEQFNEQYMQAEDLVINIQSHYQEQETEQFHEQLEEQSKHELTNKESNNFIEENILNANLVQKENENLESTNENKCQNEQEQNHSQQDNQQQMQLQQNNYEQKQFQQDNQELINKQDQLCQNNINYHTQFLKQDNYQFQQQQQNGQQQNLQYTIQQIFNQENDSDSQSSQHNNKSPQIEINAQEAQLDQSKKQSHQNSSMNLSQGKMHGQNSQGKNQNFQLSQSIQLVNLIDETSQQQDRKLEFDSKIEDESILQQQQQQQSQSQALSQQKEEKIIENFELSEVKSEDVNLLIQSKDKFLVSQAQDTKTELESQSSELLNLINQKEKLQKNAQIDKKFSEKIYQKRQVSQIKQDNKQNNLDLNNNNRRNIQSTNVKNQQNSIVLKNDQEIFKMPTKTQKSRQQNENLSQKQKQASKSNLCLIEIDSDDYICVDNKNYKVLQKPKEVTIQPSISEIDQFHSLESHDLIKKSKEQIKITKQIGAMKYLVNELSNKNQYGQFSKDKADIIINHKLNIREQHQDEVYTQFNITKCLYKVTWKKRPSGRIPQPSYFTFNELYQVAPRLLLEYLKKMATLKV
ncbi:hypothetical protein TTHERM_00998830 (macronuclear) [Tetrahymena thermophila SB210]|uniref:Uncharacterized protein n=1 Tax=Tetrahymena thermophila (strain SB210) TaxID=312017 RepID=Q22D94_TETTS|nr:hypothetical protein TTHERM_00998830 [Tetrahymena thermophila SB210]EAR83231.1 hypothetical protein TTHERM_00998830 [Tetrahymena thermophila SB210]|eukprot:XP_001030894.1 hypothetical protein TTHERM_00998830 [Tetrahymena thermophila SB210]